jgi:hypothetical protein
MLILLAQKKGSIHLPLYPHRQDALDVRSLSEAPPESCIEHQAPKRDIKQSGNAGSFVFSTRKRSTGISKDTSINDSKCRIDQVSVQVLVEILQGGANVRARNPGIRTTEGENDVSYIVAHRTQRIDSRSGYNWPLRGQPKPIEYWVRLLASHSIIAR